MGMVKYVIKRESWTVKLVKALMYLVAGAVVSAFLIEPISLLPAIQGTLFDNDLIINVISIVIGFMFAAVILFTLKYGKDANVLGWS